MNVSPPRYFLPALSYMHTRKDKILPFFFNLREGLNAECIHGDSPLISSAELSWVEDCCVTKSARQKLFHIKFLPSAPGPQRCVFTVVVEGGQTPSSHAGPAPPAPPPPAAPGHFNERRGERERTPPKSTAENLREGRRIQKGIQRKRLVGAGKSIRTASLSHQSEDIMAYCREEKPRRSFGIPSTSNSCSI